MSVSPSEGGAGSSSSSVDGGARTRTEDDRRGGGRLGTLASGIATGLAQGMSLRPAIERARRYLIAALASAPGYGQGHGPLDHAHTLCLKEWGAG